MIRCLVTRKLPPLPLTQRVHLACCWTVNSSLTNRNTFAWCSLSISDLTVNKNIILPCQWTRFVFLWLFWWLRRLQVVNRFCSITFTGIKNMYCSLQATCMCDKVLSPPHITWCCFKGLSVKMLEISKNPTAPINLLYAWKMTTLAATEVLILHFNYEFSEVRHLASPGSFQPYPSKYHFAVNLALQLAAKTRRGSSGRKWHWDVQKCGKPSACLDAVTWGFHLRDGAKWSDLLPGTELPPVGHLTGFQEDLGSPVVDSFVQNPPGNKEKRKSTVKVYMLNSRIKSTNTLFSVFFILCGNVFNLSMYY